jgi:hypothetical protein
MPVTDTFGNGVELNFNFYSAESGTGTIVDVFVPWGIYNGKDTSLNCSNGCSSTALMTDRYYDGTMLEALEYYLGTIDVCCVAHDCAKVTVGHSKAWIEVHKGEIHSAKRVMGKSVA